MKEIKSTNQLIQHLREDAEFYGYRGDLEDRAGLLRSSMVPFARWKESFKEYQWEPPEEIDPRGWHDIHDQGPVGSCFPAGHQVTLARGETRNIESIAVGDLVITHEGQAQKVVEVMHRPYTGDLYALVTETDRVIQMTHDHMVLTVLPEGGEIWKRVDSIYPGEQVIMAKPVHSTNWKDFGEVTTVRQVYSRKVQDLPVYDFEVEKDHSFVCEGLLVHNCQGQSLADAGEYLNLIVSGVEVQLSRGWAYLASQEFDGLIGRDSGSTLSGGTKAAKRGIPLEKDFDYTASYRDLYSRYKSERDSILSNKPLYKYPGSISMPDAESCYRWLSSWSGTIQIGIAWSLSSVSWEVSRYVATGGGHAINLTGYLKRSGWENDIGILLKNSHSDRWGREGWALIKPSVVDSWCRQQTVVGRSDMAAPRPRIEVIDNFRDHIAG